MALEKIAPIKTLEFNVTSDDYEKFIEDLRGDLADTNPRPPPVVSPTSGVSRPVLAKETTTDTQPPRWIHVQLNGYKGVAPKVAIRSDNVYVMGFTNSQNKWFQLNDTKYKYKLVDDKAVMVGFDGNYTTLLGAKGVDALPELNLSNNSVAEAAAKLWNWIPKAAADLYDDGGQETAMVRADPQTDLRRAVATVIVAISEAARFAAVSDVINQGWYGYEAGVTAKEVGYIRDWGDLSEALLKWKDAGYKNDATIFSKFQKIGINNGEQALAVVALVKQIIRSTSSTAAAGDLLAYADELPKLGRYMAEVFAVHVPAAGGGRPPLRGTVSFHGGHYCSGFLYSHEEQDSCCDSQGNIVLTGPSVAISAYSPIVFSLDLHDGSSSQSQAGRIVCDTAAGDFCSYDRAITETVETGYGPAEVTYAVLTNGVQGRVAVKIADEEGSGVLGRIVARSKLFDVGCVLFYNKGDKQGMRVPPGELLLPLARDALAVPLHMPLTIELDLRRSSSGDEIARGELEFNPAIEGQQTQRLVGVNGAELEVTISWSEYPW